MKDEKQTTTPTPVTENVKKVDEPIVRQSVLVMPRNVDLSQVEALRAAIRAKKSFKLVRKVYQGKNAHFYFGYSIIAVLRGPLPCKEIRLLPDVGFVAKGDEIGASKSNSTSYSMLNLMYDFGNGCSLVVREDEFVDKANVVRTTFNFYAVSTDESGVQQEYALKPATVGERAMLISAFTGFGGARDWETEDFNSKDSPLAEALSKLFVGYCAPGRSSDYTVENA